MRTLELKDICGYLPYGLKMSGKDNSIFPIENNLYINSLMSKIFMYKHLTPILRPLSDLYRTITHNGKEIVPIVELAKIYNKKIDWQLSQNAFGDTIAQYIEDDYQYSFGFFDNGFVATRLGRVQQVSNQVKLFDLLNELKIDYRGLIDEGLAIDCNTLEINPYK